MGMWKKLEYLAIENEQGDTYNRADAEEAVDKALKLTGYTKIGKEKHRCYTDATNYKYREGIVYKIKSDRFKNDIFLDFSDIDKGSMKIIVNEKDDNGKYMQCTDIISVYMYNANYSLLMSLDTSKEVEKAEVRRMCKTYEFVERNNVLNEYTAYRDMGNIYMIAGYFNRHEVHEFFRFSVLEKDSRLIGTNEEFRFGVVKASRTFRNSEVGLEAMTELIDFYKKRIKLENSLG